ncbi:MAG: ABC1 kinase family protein, partial [Terriglobales bacterium]
ARPSNLDAKPQSDPPVPRKQADPSDSRKVLPRRNGPPANVSGEKRGEKTGAPPKKADDAHAPQVVTAASGPAVRTTMKVRDAAVPSSYDPVLADRAAEAKNLLTDRRFLKMAKTLMRFSLEACADKVLTSRRDDPDGTRKSSAQRLRQALVDLGPTFIKLGQFLSVRRDCLSPEMADELALLQDKVPPFSIELVRKTITSELGAPPEELFERFDTQPIASASIGQVHKAILKDGRPVVMKIQRPDLGHRFYQDLGCMRKLAHWGLLLKPEGQWQSWLELSDEFGRNLFQEINYLQEGRNADRIRTMLKNHPDIQIPRVYWKYTGRRVLTLEYLPGTKVDRVKELEAQGINRSKIGNQLVTVYLEMVLMHGFFHADPHAGNI